MSKDEFVKLLELTLNDTYFRFGSQLFKQTQGLAMGSCISPIAANIFLNHFETQYLTTCPDNCKPKLYKRYLDDTFIVFENADKAKKFYNYVNSLHQSIKFTMEKEENATLSFLDVCVTRQDNQFVTSIFRKKTFTGL